MKRPVGSGHRPLSTPPSVEGVFPGRMLCCVGPHAHGPRMWEPHTLRWVPPTRLPGMDAFLLALFGQKEPDFFFAEFDNLDPNLLCETVTLVSACCEVVGRFL